MVTNNVTVYQFEVGLDEVFADEVRFRVNVDCVIVVVVKDCLFFVSFIICENCEFVKWMCWMWAHFPVGSESRCNLSIQIESSKATTCRLHPSLLCCVVCSVIDLLSSLLCRVSVVPVVFCLCCILLCCL